VHFSQGQTILSAGSLETQVMEQGKALHICTQTEVHRSMFLQAAGACTPAQLNTVHTRKHTQISIF